MEARRRWGWGEFIWIVWSDQGCGGQCALCSVWGVMRAGISRESPRSNPANSTRPGLQPSDKWAGYFIQHSLFFFFSLLRYDSILFIKIFIEWTKVKVGTLSQLVGWIQGHFSNQLLQPSNVPFLREYQALWRKWIFGEKNQGWSAIWFFFRCLN